MNKLHYELAETIANPTRREALLSFFIEGAPILVPTAIVLATGYGLYKLIKTFENTQNTLY